MSTGKAAERCILVVDDNEAECVALGRVLRLEGFQVRLARSPAEALAHTSTTIDLVISDLRMGAESGLDLLRAWRRQRPLTPFVLLTAYGTVDQAVTAMKEGAEDFLTKPVDPAKLLDLVRRALGPPPGLEHHEETMRRINEGLEREPFVGHSPLLGEVCAQALRAASFDSTVLILGESGTGKELIAEALHCHSPRRAGPFVVINMAAIPEALAESELFGHVKGAFTTAHRDRVGRFQAAGGGTLFIDEIGDVSLSVQAKLLRVLEARRITPVGGSVEVPVDVRVVAATSRPLAKLTASGAFREDLYFRLNVIGLHLPPLRERRQDIPLLAQHFLERFAGSRPLRIGPDLLQWLEAYDWPGNIRELRNCLERMIVLAQAGVLTMADLPPELLNEIGKNGQPPGPRLESVKKSAILEAVNRFGGNRTRAAEFLGISVRTLQRKLRGWGQIGLPSDGE
jgi:DNA-binding NtrC family response regulator